MKTYRIRFLHFITIETRSASMDAIKENFSEDNYVIIDPDRSEVYIVPKEIKLSLIKKKFKVIPDPEEGI